ncbi:sulfurtransferase [Robiginitomaculum antarcticum]|uniref:sulfurtransferase n=1 Tax=Robiginitomaculum antarcticum TaxID=437507 RepID=UPI0003AA69A4|nr:sulfurtransferase [Robiginitomaculum antarcticum]
MDELATRYYRGSDLTHRMMLMMAYNEVFIDATWELPGTEDNLPVKYLAGAIFFDLGKIKTLTPLGAAFPPADHVAKMADAMGISNDDHLILYDRNGLFSAPRVWWTFKSVGHKKVEIINGGLPAIIAGGYSPSISDKLRTPTPSKGYIPSPPLVKGVTIEEVLIAIENGTQIVDARSHGRFSGTEPEPRKGLRSGHIPGSINLPLGNLLNDKKCITDETKHKIAKAGIDLSKPIITTCGSGVTAAGLAFIFDVFGAKDVSVYSGSWAQYGASSHPIETGP